MGERGRPRVDLRYAQRVVDVNVGVLGPRIPGMINVGKKKGTIYIWVIDAFFVCNR